MGKFFLNIVYLWLLVYPVSFTNTYANNHKCLQLCPVEANKEIGPGTFRVSLNLVICCVGHITYSFSFEQNLLYILPLSAPASLIFINKCEIFVNYCFRSQWLFTDFLKVWPNNQCSAVPYHHLVQRLAEVLLELTYCWIFVISIKKYSVFVLGNLVGYSWLFCFPCNTFYV